MSAFLQDPMNIYAVAFVIFIALAYYLGRKPVKGWLDSEISKISAELSTARELREEAEAALAEIKSKQQRAEIDAQQIVQMAKQQAESMRKQAETELASTLAHHEQLASDRIHLVEEKAMQAVRDAAVTMGMELARKALSEKLSEEDAERLVDQAIAEIPSLKAQKKKA